MTNIIVLLILSFTLSISVNAQNGRKFIGSIIVLNENSKISYDKLKDILKNKQVVLLGEQSHGDGSTFEIKTTLIKYLHEDLGFDIIAFESGFYDCEKVGKKIELGEDPIEAARLGIFRIWSKSEQTQELFRYIGRQIHTPHAIKMVGIDCQPTGKYSRDSLGSELGKYLLDINMLSQNMNMWNSFKSGLSRLFSNASQRFNHTEIDSFSVLCRSISKLIQNSTHRGRKKIEQEFWIQTLKNIDVYAKIVSSSSAKEWQKRDEQMADNVQWLLKHYKNKKIIIWGATDHFLKNQYLISGETYSNNFIERMGNIINRSLKNQIYSIGFTAFSGSYLNIGTNQISVLTPPKPGSLEEFMGRIPGETLFMDCKSQSAIIRKNLGEKYYSRVLGNVEMYGNWTDCLDGIIFIRNLKPSVIRN